MYLDRWHFQDTTSLCGVGPIISSEHAAELTWQRNKEVKFTVFYAGKVIPQSFLAALPFDQRQMPYAITTQSRSGNLPLPWLRMLLPKSIFSFVSVIAPKGGWGFSPGWCSQWVSTSCGVLFFSGSLAICSQPRGSPCGLFPNGTPKPFRAIITVPSPRQLVKGCGQEDCQSRAWKGINGEFWNTEVGIGQQVSLKPQLELLVTQVDVLSVVLKGTERALDWHLCRGVPEILQTVQGREIPDGHIQKQPVCLEPHYKRYWGQTLLPSTALAQLLTIRSTGKAQQFLNLL